MKYIVTYGNGTKLANCYSLVEGNTPQEIEQTIFNKTEGKHSMMYPYDEYSYMIKEYNLNEVPLQPHR